MVYSKLYESLQYTLNHASWLPILAQSPTSFSGPLFPRTRPFAGLWTCKTGIILWKRTTKGPMLRVFSLQHASHAPFLELTKCYWHLIFRGQFLAKNHRSLLLRLLHTHNKLLQLYDPGISSPHEGRTSIACSKSLVDPVVDGNCEQTLQSFTVRFPGVSVIRMLIEHTVGSLRTWSCFEPPLAEGKARVRWLCVSSALTLS